MADPSSLRVPKDLSCAASTAWCRSNSQWKRANYIWSIENFTHRWLAMCMFRYRLKSSEFGVMADGKKYHFYLELHRLMPKYGAHVGKMCCTVDLMSATPSSRDNVIYSYKISVIDSKKKKVHGRSFEENVSYQHSDSASHSLCRVELIEKDDLMGNKDLLSNGTLTLHCEIDVFCVYANLSGTHERDFTVSDDVDGLTLPDDLGVLLKGQGLSDVTLTVGGENFPVHKSILGARSPVFFAMFEHEMEERRTGVVDIADVDPRVMEEVLTFIYTDKTTSNFEGMARDVLAAADKYCLKNLKTKCEKVLHESMSTENVFEILCLADRHNSKELLALAVDFVNKSCSISTLGRFASMDTSSQQDIVEALKRNFPGIK